MTIDKLVPIVVTVVFTTGELVTYGPSLRRLNPPYKRGRTQSSLNTLVNVLDLTYFQTSVCIRIRWELVKYALSQAYPSDSNSVV